MEEGETPRIEPRMQSFEKERNEGLCFVELEDKSRIYYEIQFEKLKNEKNQHEEFLEGIDLVEMEAIKLESVKITNNPSDRATIRKNHNMYMESYFDLVEDEEELKGKHEQYMKLAIDKYIAANPIESQKREKMINQFREELDADFEALLVMFKLNKKGFEQMLENAIKFYTREMQKLIPQSKFIFVTDLEELHEKYKKVSHDKLREELSNRYNPTRTAAAGVHELLDRSIEVFYDKFKRQNLSNILLKPAIGIDLGTTFSCVGVMYRGKVHIISNTFGFKTTPSCIAFSESDKEFVGNAAEDQAFQNPANTIFEVKRMIGRNYNDIDIQEDMKLWPFHIIDEKNSLKVKLRNDDNITLYPEELSAKVLSRLKSDAENFLGFKVKNAVITVPAYFNDAQRQATKDAGLLAGLNVLQLLNEPTAAAIAYNHQIREDFRKNVLIYDLGGGTFDVAVIAVENGIIDVKAVGGDAHLGGVDFDQRIMNYLFEKFKDEFTENHEKEIIERAKARLRYRCEKKKCELSEMSSTNISIDVLLPGWDFKYELTRKLFDDLCIDLFKKTIEIVDETLKYAKMVYNDINDVILIGGSTKIPKIQTLLKEYFVDKSLNKEISPDEAVAYGATIQAARLNGETFIDSNRTVISDVLPFSIGIEVYDKSMAVIIPKNSKIPIVKSQIFKTVENNQTFVRIQIFEGEDKLAKQNRLLGIFEIDGIPKKPAGEETVKVIIEIDREGILHIKEVISNGSADLTVKDNRGRICAKELKMLMNQGNTNKSNKNKKSNKAKNSNSFNM